MQIMFLLLFSLLLLLTSSTKPPHIIYVLVDDLGWANVQFHNPRMKTPFLVELLSESIYLDNFYVYMYCSPTRSSLLSGRLPYHVSQFNGDICMPNFGVNLNMTLISEKLSDSASKYISHQLGKWHVGSSSFNRIPTGRGFETSLGYFSGQEDHYTQIAVNGNDCNATDLYNTTHPAFGLNNTDYSGYIYVQNALDIINSSSRNTDNPLFLYLALQNNHCPFQVPQEYIDQFNSSWNQLQRTCAGMSLFVDNVIYNITTLLKQNGMWNNTLMIITADNGGPNGGQSPQGHNHTDPPGANNSPLRGGKFSNFQGGVRVIAMLSGGFIPTENRGTNLTIQDGMMHISDFYSTLCHVGGNIDPFDYKANSSSTYVPNIDSLNMWDWIIQKNKTCPRNEIFLASGQTVSTGSDGGMIYGRFKLLFGIQSPAFWTTDDYPNGTYAEPVSIDCGSVENGGCLFDLISDPTEHIDLASNSSYSDILATIRSRFIELSNTTYTYDRGQIDPNCCAQTQLNGGYFAPWL